MVGPARKSLAEIHALSTAHFQSLWAPKAMYAISSAGQSALINFLPVFYQNAMHFNKVQIGVLQTLPSLCAMLAPPFWGAIADRIKNQRLVHVFCIVSGAVLLFALQFSTSFVIAVVLLLFGNFQVAPAQSLLDHAVLVMLSKVGGEYGKQRLFGAVGYGAGAYVAGMIVTAAGIAWSFHLSLILALASLLVLRSIPPIHDDDPYKYTEIEDTELPVPVGSSFLDGLRQLLKKKDVMVLLVVVFFMSLMFGILSSYLTLNLFNFSGENANIIGIAIMCETTSELPAFFYSQLIIDKIGTVKVLLLSIIGYAARITYLVFMTNPWWAIPFEFLHGVTFGIAWVACTQYIYQAAPPGCEGTVMGILNAVQNGLGRAVGTLVGGFFYQYYGPQIMWLVADIGVPLSLAGVAMFAYLKNKDEIELEDDILGKVELFSPHSPYSLALKSPAFARSPSLSFGGSFNA